ncbi:hypothetical protein J437_LFUL005023, partial [Ladona fulva]
MAMSPMKRYKMVCERRLTSTDVCIHPRRSTEDTGENSELDVTTTATSSESFQYALKKRHGNKEKCIPESTSSSLLGPSVGDTHVDTVDYTGELINFMINGETEIDEESESKSSEEVERHLSPGDVAYNQMRFILSPRADDLILGVINACKYCCMEICRGHIDFMRETKKKSKCKRRGEIQDWMKMEVSREKDGHPVDKKGRKKLQDETTSMEGDNIRTFEQKRLDLEKALEEEKITLLEEKCKLEEEKRKIMEERMKLMEKKKRLLGEAIASSTEENIYETQRRLEDDIEDKDTATEIKSSSADQKSVIREGGSFEGRVSTADNEISREMESKSSSMDNYNLERRSALKGDSMEMGKRTSSDRGSKELYKILGAQATSFESKSAEIKGSPEMRSFSSLQRRSIDLGSREERRNGSGKGSKDIESTLQKKGSTGSRKSAEMETIPQKLNGSGLERSTEMGSYPQATDVCLESISTNTGPTSQATRIIEERSSEYYSLPEIKSGSSFERRCFEMRNIPHLASSNFSAPEMVKSFTSERRSAEFGVIPEKVSGFSPRGSVEMENIPRVERSSDSERRSGEIGTIPGTHSCSCEGKRSIEMGSILQREKSNGSERRSGEIGTIPGRFSDSSVGKRSTEMGSIPQIVKSNGSERRSGEIGIIPERHSCSSEGKRSTEIEDIPQIAKSNGSERSGDIGIIPERHSCSCLGKRSTEMGSIPQIVKNNGSEHRSGELRDIRQTASRNSVARKSTDVVSNAQEIKSSYSDRRSAEMGSNPQFASYNALDRESKECTPQAARSPELEIKSSEMDDNKEENDMKGSELRSPDKGRIRELIANYAIVKKSAGTLSAPEALNFSSVIEDITPEEFKKLQEEDLRRLKMKSLELQVLKPGEYKEYREEELLKLGKAIEQRRLEWQAIENRRREEEEELRFLERDIKEKLKAVADGEIDSYIQKKSEEEELEKQITELEEDESQSKLCSKSSICSCLRRKWQEREKKKELSKKEGEKKIGSPRQSKGSYQSQDLCREVEDRKSMGTMEEVTKIGSERESGSETLRPIRSSPRTFNVSDDVAPDREGATEFRKSDSVGSTKYGHLCKKLSFERDKMCSHHLPRHQLEVSSSEKLRRKFHSEEEIVAFTMGQISEENNQNRISETKPPAPITDREKSSFGAEDKDRIEANCFESDDSIGYKIDIENVIARERSFTKYKIREKSSDTLKRSLDYGIPASRTHSKDIDGGDKGEIYGKQSSDTLGKSLHAGPSLKSSPSVRSSLSVRRSHSRHDSQSDVARVDANVVEKSSDTLKRSLDYSVPISGTRSNDIDGGDKGEIYGKQSSDTLGKSLNAGPSLRSSPSVRSSRSRYDSQSDIARVDTNVVQKSSDTLKRSLDYSTPASGTRSNDIDG